MCSPAQADCDEASGARCRGSNDGECEEVKVGGNREAGRREVLWKCTKGKGAWI